MGVFESQRHCYLFVHLRFQDLKNKISHTVAQYYLLGRFFSSVGMSYSQGVYIMAKKLKTKFVRTVLISHFDKNNIVFAPKLMLL